MIHNHIKSTRNRGGGVDNYQARMRAAIPSIVIYSVSVLVSVHHFLMLRVSFYFVVSTPSTTEILGVSVTGMYQEYITLMYHNKRRIDGKK